MKNIQSGLTNAVFRGIEFTRLWWFAPITYYNVKNAQARILIALDNIEAEIPLGVHQRSTQDLIVSRCRLGWAVHGRRGITSSNTHRVLHVCPCSPGQNMDEILKSYFARDSVGIKISSSAFESKENERAQQLIEMTLKFIYLKKDGKQDCFDSIITVNSLIPLQWLNADCSA